MLLEPHSSLKISVVQHHIVWMKCLPERCYSGLQASIPPYQVQKQVWTWQHMASPFQASSIIELKNNIIPCSKPFLRQQSNMGFSLFHISFMHSFILSYFFSFSSFVIDFYPSFSIFGRNIRFYHCAGPNYQPQYLSSKCSPLAHSH